MQDDIDAVILEQAADCPYEFGCLDGTRCDMCTVERYIRASAEAEALFVFPGESTSCPCMIEFGDSHVCTCPMRSKLHRRQHKMTVSAGNGCRIAPVQGGNETL